MSEFGKGLIYNLILFAKHFMNSQAETIGHYDFVMSKSQEERNKILSDNPDSSHNYGWNKDVKWWYERIVPNWGSPEKALSRSIEMWANGASDHLYELVIPEKLEDKKVGQSLKKLKEKALEMGHSFPKENIYTYEDFMELHDITEEIGNLLDIEFGIESEKAQWN